MSIVVFMKSGSFTQQALTVDSQTISSSISFSSLLSLSLSFSIYRCFTIWNSSCYIFTNSWWIKIGPKISSWWTLGTCQQLLLEIPWLINHSITLHPVNRFLNPKSSYERHAIPNPSRLESYSRWIVDRQPPCDLMCWKVIHGWRLERRAQRLFPFFTGALQTLSVNNCRLETHGS